MEEKGYCLTKKVVKYYDDAGNETTPEKAVRAEELTLDDNGSVLSSRKFVRKAREHLNPVAKGNGHKGRKIVVGVAIILAVLGVGGALYYFSGANTGSGSVSTSSPIARVTGNSIQITQASLTPNGALSVTVVNTGSTNLLGLSLPSLNPSPGGYGGGGGWNPQPSTTYPIYPGETIQGTWTFFPVDYRSGIQVVVSVQGTFSFCGDGGGCWAFVTTAYTLTVSG